VIRRTLVFLAICWPGWAHDVISTRLLWTQEISRIVYKHCAACHREGGAAPMALATYEQARPWAKAIRDEVAARRMPPWGPVKGIGDFRDDPSLSQVEIDMIVNWVEGGAPKGDDIYLPHFPSPPRELQAEGSEFTMDTGAERTLDSDLEATGIRPKHVAPGASLDLTAVLPNGAVQHLIWIRGWRPEWQCTFYFRQPVRLPKGTRLIAHSGKPAEITVRLR
jgi:hypothetical protein